MILFEARWQGEAAKLAARRKARERALKAIALTPHVLLHVEAFTTHNSARLKEGLLCDSPHA